MDVLLVDDSRVMRQLVRRTLRHAGYEFGTVEEAGDGVEALAKLSGFRPSFILSDWNMPNMTGIELLKELRAKGDQTPLAFVTSESTNDMRVLAETHGAMFLLSKPFTPENVRHKLDLAGFEPTGSLARNMGSHTAASTFDANSLSALVSNLVDARVEMKPGPKFSPTGKPVACARWVDHNDELVYAGFAELALAASFGARLGLRPASAVTQMLESKTIEASLVADIREVFNVISRAFNDAGSVHVRLEEIYVPPDPAPRDALRMQRKAEGRLDLMVQVPGFGSGRLTIVSMASDLIVRS
jgi:two-component system chemotaxis response regulator CheY